MIIGVKAGARGDAVSHLQRVLISAGCPIELGEVDRGEFGSSTLAALHVLQTTHGLNPANEIDAPTLEILLKLERNITINIREASSPTVAKVHTSHPHRGKVSGKLVDQDGASITDAALILIEKQLRLENTLGHATTDAEGQYTIHYARPKALDLLVRASHPAGEVIATSPTVFLAPADTVIDLTTARDGVVRTPSTLSSLSTSVQAALGETPLADLKQNKDAADIEFLARSVGVDFRRVANLFIARGLASKHELNEATLFGLFSQGIPPSLSSALGNLPDAGIDEPFTASVLRGVLVHPRPTLDRVLQAAVTANVLPTSYAAIQEAQLARLDTLRVESFGRASYLRGKTPLNDLLAAGSIPANAHTAFVKAYADNVGRLEPTWKTLRADKTLSKEDRQALNTVLSAGELLAGNLPLVKDTLQRLSQGAIQHLRDLALLDLADWEARLRELDPEAATIPQVLHDHGPAERITRFALSLVERFTGRYPTTAFVGGLAKSSASSFKTRDEIVPFLTANPTLNFRRSNLDQFIATKKLAISAPALAELKTAQRLHRLTPHYANVEALHGAGYKSAQSIYFKGCAPFLAHMTPALGSPSQARMAYARAHMAYATSLAAFGRYNLGVNGARIAAIPAAAPDAQSMAGLPDVQALFGSLDYFQCDDCQSVYSPAAYLVDLLQYIGQFTAQNAIVAATFTFPICVTTAMPHGLNPGDQVTTAGITGLNGVNGTFTITEIPSPTSFMLPVFPVGYYRGGGTIMGPISYNARDVLLTRRPEIKSVALTCDNTNITIPYIDLVNEILESAVADPGIPRPTEIATLGTSAERRALPQPTQPAVAAAAYAATKAIQGDPASSAVPTMFPLSLPFDVDFSRTTAYLAALGTSRADLLSLFSPGANAPLIAGAALGINPTMQSVINQVDVIDPWTRWGLAESFPVVTNPKTGQVYIPYPVDWVAALNWVPVFLGRAGLSLPQLYQLLEVQWVTQSGVELQLGTTYTAGVQILSSNTEQMAFTGLTGDVLERANRFLRLWTASDLQMWELDWALGDGALDDSFLVFLAGAISIQNRLGLPFQEVLTFWTPIETRDVTSHLGDADVTVPSTYTEVFGNPTMLTSWQAVFGALPPASGGLQILFPTPGAAASGPVPAPTAQQLQPLNGIAAALGLSAADIAAIMADSGAANGLNLATLTALLRYQRLAGSLSLSVTDLILWIALTGVSPFGGLPSNTLEFLRRLALLQRTGIAPHDLDYLLRGQSASQSALAFTTAQVTAVLQSVRDSVAKAAGVGPLMFTNVAQSTDPTLAGLISVTTATAHGLATGTQVFVAGVTGMTNANGIFTVSVTDATSFILDGSTANGTWLGGGAVIAGLADLLPSLTATIQPVILAALVTATGVTADVVTPVLTKTGLLTLDETTVGGLLIQASVDPTQFPTLVTAFTQVAKASALFTALSLSPATFTFLVQNASTFRWLDPSSLPVVPVATSSYPAFEALLQALKLQQRQAARTPKFFDVLTQWLQPGQLPADIATAIAGPVIPVAGASNATPIEIATAAPHGLPSGVQVTISGVVGNTSANGTFTITVTGANSFTLDGSSGNGDWVSGGVVSALDGPSIAFALNASVANVTTLAAALGITAPSLDPTQQAGTLADVGSLTALANALDVVSRYGIDGTTLLMLAAPAPDANSSAAAMGTLQAQYPQSAWLAAVQPVEDSLRELRRDALVAYLLGSGSPSVPAVQFLTTDDIFNYYLIDPEMCACGETTRILQPSLAIQQLVQQVFLGLVYVGAVDTTDGPWSQWSWRQQYRLWQANREVFLYPENYLLPELRTNASPFFTDLENDLRQSNCDADAVEAAFQNYIRKLVSVANLVVAAHYFDNQANPPVLWVFAHTRGTPAQWFYRTRTGSQISGTWTAWTPLNLDLATDHLIPVIWDRRLHLIWPTFKQISEQQSSQTPPTLQPADGTYPAQNPAATFWSVQFAISEFSAGQWQPKRMIDEKMFFNKNFNFFAEVGPNDLPGTGITTPADFSFKAVPSSGLQLQVYYQYSSDDTAANDQTIQALGDLPTPDAPLLVTEDPNVIPDPNLIDLNQEPTYALVTTSPTSFSSPLIIPTSCKSDGQDLTNTTSALYVLSLNSRAGSPTNVELLGNIPGGRIVVPQQETIFDSEDPFFITDPSHSFLVQPTFYSVSSSHPEVALGSSVQQWSTAYQFQSFYHPYARTFLRELEIGGIPQLMSRALQTDPEDVRGWPALDFSSYSPQSSVQAPYPTEIALDFAPGSSGPFSLYNWEIFYHGPMFVASLLMQNQQYQDAMTWLEYVFNPTDTSTGAAPQRFWQTAPLYQLSDWSGEDITTLLSDLAAYSQQGQSDPSNIASQITAWMNDPFDPHMVASTRVSAYGKATVMKFLDNLLAWGDSLYSQYTAESVNQAEQLYILADMLLGPAPDQLRLPEADAGPSPTYATLQNLDLFSNVLVNIENIIVAPEPPPSLVDGSSQPPTLPQLPANGTSLLFCVPPNEQMLAYWGNVAQRLYNIRHCLNQQGAPQPLPLYAPPLDPLQLIAEKAAGSTPSSNPPPVPTYRFATYLQKAVELTNDVRAYGTLILSALEKQDAETLSVLRANQEVDIQTRLLDVKAQQITEAQDQKAALVNQQAITQIRYNFYSSIAFLNPAETAAISLQTQALALNRSAVPLDISASIIHLLPEFSVGVAGFGGTPTMGYSFGGGNIASSESASASAIRGTAGVLGEMGAMSATMGGYQRRQDEWTLQANLAQAELTQIASQIVAANDRINIANSEYSTQSAQIANASTISTFLTNKYTNAQLYDWMVTQLSTVFTQAYQLAFGLALQAQTAYQYELGRPADQFIQFAYWDSQHKGLTAGESLLFDLRRMEASYLANNVREAEITKHVSLALTQPLALVQLLQTGSCSINLDESLFDQDHPGQYFRRLRAVAVTIPCVTGPYTGVNATLGLSSSRVRTAPPAAPYQSYSWSSTNNYSGISTPPPTAVTPIIATSSGQNDSGLFETSLHDERWLPFEGQGAVSQWSLTLDPRDNNFDLTTVTDVVLHLRYSARFSGSTGIVRDALKPMETPRTILMSVRNTFGDAYYGFFNPTDTTATQQTLTVPLTNAIFPFSNLGAPGVTNVTVIMALAEPMPAGAGPLSVSGTFGLTGAASQDAVSLLPQTGAPSAAGSPIVAFSGAAALSQAAPASMTLTIPPAGIPPQLQVAGSAPARLNPTLISDIVFLITYTIGS